MSKKHKKEAKAPPICKKCKAAAANMRDLCDRCFSAGEASMKKEMDKK